MIKSKRAIAGASLVLLIAAVAGASFAQDAASAIAARQKDMATINMNAQAIQPAVASGNLAAAKTAATAIDTAFKSFATEFPAGSDTSAGKTRATPLVFSDPAAFKAQLDKAITVSDTLLAATNGTDPAAVSAAASALNNACTTCHATFRGPPLG